MKEIELIGKRKAREKHFLKENGIITANVYDEDIHFLKDGKYEEIDNTLVEENGYLVNKNNAYKVYFSKKSKDELMQMSVGNNYIKTRLVYQKEVDIKENITQSKLHKNICYPDIIDNVDLEYNVMPGKVKEAIILKNKNVDLERLFFLIETNTKLELKENKKIISTVDNNNCFEFDTPYMVDANFKTNNNINYKLTKIDDGIYELELIIDKEWLNNEETTYPVMIDPTITNSGQNNSVYDTYIGSGDNADDNNGGYDGLFVGVSPVSGIDSTYRTLLKFELPTIGTGSQIVDATINLIGYPIKNWSPDTQLLAVHRITAPWDEMTATWNTMNDKYDKKVENIFYSMRSKEDDNGVITPFISTVSITNLVRKWYTGTLNYGVMLKANKEIKIDASIPMFFSKNNTVIGSNPKPVLAISYRNQNGIEDYMDYQIQSFSKGNAYANIYNGNLTTVFNVGQTIAGKFPVELNLVYNTNDIVLNNNYGYGCGYKLSLYQTIKEQTIEDKNYLEYMDEDGTLHYFLNQKVSFGDNGYNISDTENIYYDEDGLDMNITKNNDNYILKDKNGNTMKFIKNGNIAYLSEIEDVSGNKIIITYNSNNLITKITDANNSEINISYENNLTTIVSPIETVKLNYNNNQLVNINSLLGNTYFEYNINNLISKITDISGLSTLYEYYNQVPYKVKKISVYSTENTLSDYFELTYGFDSTTITDSKNKSRNVIFNSQGSVVSISGFKNKDDINSAYGLSQENGINDGTNPGYNNKLISTEIPIGYVKNYLSNTSFEKENINFNGTDNVVLSISNEFAETGVNSLKVNSTSDSQEIIQNISVEKGKFYTFSVFIKNNNNAKLMLSYTDSNNIIIESVSEKIVPSDVFERYDVTLDYPETAISDLTLKICFDTAGTAYIDDVQLEVGEVVNNYNLLENSDFSNGFSDWILSAYDPDTGNELSTTDKFEIVSLNNGTKALKIKKNPSYSLSMEKTFNINGKGGDTFNISFWYKNMGILSNLSPDYGSRVYINFIYNDDTFGHCSIPSPVFNPNDESWQYVSNNFTAEKDYKSITISFSHIYDANDLYITNMSLFKNIRNVYYEYDEYGNVITENNLDNNNIKYNYDKNNQLIQMINPKGKTFTYEYDNIISDKIINTMSDLGISNQIKYDNNNNPITTKNLKTGFAGDISDGLYKIRIKGTNKYLKNILNEVRISSDDYNPDVWKIDKNEDYFKIYHSIITNKFLTVKDNKLILTNDSGDNSLFEFHKNKNNSYNIKLKTDNKYLKYNDNEITIETISENDFNFEFYFETTESTIFVENNATYSEDGRFIKNVNDSLGNTTTYDIYEDLGLTKSITDSKENIINYNYNNKRLLSSVNYDKRQVLYSYNDKNLISKITVGTKEYNFIYDKFLNIKKIKIGDNITLINNNYNTIGELLSITYGNNDVISYEYDEYHRLKKQVNENDAFNYKYDNSGNLIKIISNNDIIKYSYDLSKKISQYKFNNFKIKYNYDSNQNITDIKYCLNDISDNIETIYNDDDLITKTIFDDNELNYDYDELGRVESSNINNLYNTKVEYVTNGNRTSQLIRNIISGEDTYSYKYDKLNNITHIYYNRKLKNRYYYDKLSELIKEKDYFLNIIIKYNYDNLGNILSKITYDLDTYSIINIDKYSYNNWEDLLSKYNDDEIVSDSIGNPVSIGTDINLNWVNGRQLDSYSDTSKTVFYRYNVDGNRISKKINGVETTYYLEDNDIIYEKTGNNVLYYIRSTMDDLVGLKYNNNLYYYLKNAQGDIIGILDSTFNVIARYEYDSWGKILSITDNNGNDISNDINNIANINPYRYRSYYYDKETGLYYLNSRYYNPEWGRFINADSHITTGQGFNSYNMFCYCANNPINKADLSGMFWEKVGKFLKKAGKKLKKALEPIGNLFKAIGTVASNMVGVSSTKKTVINTSSYTYVPDPLPITVKTGTKENTVISKKGNSSKLITVYNEKDIVHPIKSSTIGAKLNIGNFSLNLGFGFDNSAISGSLKHGKNTDSLGLRVNLSELKIGAEYSTEIEWDKKNSETIYGNTDVNGWFLVWLYSFVTAGQPVTAPAYAYPAYAY